MRYLGGSQGAGVLKSEDDETGVRATYDFDGFLRKNDQVASCGEIRMSSAALRDVFGRRDLRLFDRGWTGPSPFLFRKEAQCSG
jgi:hypothetical protein